MRRMLSFLILFLFLLPGLAIAQWESAHGPDGGIVNALFEDGGNVYSGAAAGVFRSSDGGATWTSVLGGIAPSGVYSFGAHGGALFAGTSESSVMKSTDGGLSWIETSSGNGSVVVDLVSSGGALYSGSAWGGIWRTTDLGQTWEERNNGLPSLRTGNLIHVGGALLVGLRTGEFYRSTDDGGNWTDLSAAIPAGEVRAACEHAGAAYAYIYGNGIYKSTDEGVTWNPTTATGDYRELYSDGSRLYALDNTKLWFTDDGGATWTDRTMLAGYSAAICLVKSGGRLFAGHAVEGVSVSTDEGLNWTASSRGLSGSRVYAVLESGQNLFAGPRDDGLYRSTDGGNLWTKLPVVQYFRNAKALVERSNVLFCGSNVGILSSTDAGGTWQTATGGAGYAISCLSEGSTVMFAGSNQGEVLSSTDDGVTWSLRGNLGTNSEIIAIIDNGSVVMASTSSHGMFVSTDGGATWTASNNGIEGSPSSQDILFLDGVWYLAKNPGLYISTDNGQNWILKENSIRQSSPNRLVGVNGGIVVGDYSFGIFFYDIKDTLWTQISEGYEGSAVVALSENNGTVLLGSYANGVWTREVDELIPTPAISVSPLTVDFGEIEYGSGLVKKVTVENTGDGTVRLRTLAIVGSDAGEFSLRMNYRNILHPGESTNLEVEFFPTEGRTYAAELVITSNDASTPEHRVSLSGSGQGVPRIVVDKSLIAFPGVEVGSMRAQPLTIENQGDADLEISEIKLAGTDSLVYVVRNGGSMVIAPGTSREVSIEFTPAAEKAYSATLTIKSNDRYSPALSVDVWGLGTGKSEPDIELDRSVINFGSVTVGSRKVEMLTVRNTGTTALVISGLTLQGLGAGEFAIDNGSASSLQPSQEMTITLAFAPTKIGMHSADFIIASNDPDMPNAIVSLSGNALVTSVDDPAAAPRTLLLQNHPNPVAGSTVIPFLLRERTHVRVELFDLLGRPLLLLHDAELPEGSHSLRLNASALPTGVYIYRLSTDRDVLTREFVVTAH